MRVSDQGTRGDQGLGKGEKVVFRPGDDVVPPAAPAGVASDGLPAAQPGDWRPACHHVCLGDTS